MAGAKSGVHVCQLKPIVVPEFLTKGNKFIMFNDNSTMGTPVTLKVDERGYILYWRDQNKEMDFLDISLIKDTRTGSQVKIPKGAVQMIEKKLIFTYSLRRIANPPRWMPHRGPW